VLGASAATLSAVIDLAIAGVAPQAQQVSPHRRPPGASPAERGAVSRLPDATLAAFEGTFGMAQEAAAAKQFGCSGFVVNDLRFKWLLVQVQAVCDFAQRQPGPLPFVLGLEMPVAFVSKASAPSALIKTPPFERGGTVVALHVNARFQINLPAATAATMVVEYRLRESLLNDMAYELHSYGARSGIISLRESKPKRFHRPRPMQNNDGAAANRLHLRLLIRL
jgi:hypothetical protein